MLWWVWLFAINASFGDASFGSPCARRVIAPDRTIERAEIALVRKLSERERSFLNEAHLIGSTEAGYDGRRAGIRPNGTSNFTQSQIIRKYRTLRRAFSPQDTRLLMERGIAGVDQESIHATRQLIVPNFGFTHLDILVELEEHIPFRTASRIATLETMIAPLAKTNYVAYSKARASLQELKTAVNLRHREISTKILKEFSGFSKLIPAFLFRNRVRNRTVETLENDLIVPAEQAIAKLMTPKVLPSFAERVADFRVETASMKGVGNQNFLVSSFSKAFADRVIITPNALSTVEGYPMIGERLISMLEILADEAYTLSKSGVFGTTLDQQLVAAASKRGGIRYAHGDTAATKEKYGHLRQFEYRGKTYDATPHLKFNGTPMIRIYFVYSPTEDKVIVWHIGPHLPSVSGDR